MSDAIRFAQAIADNAGENETELVFKKGDILGVVDTNTGSDDWWEGYLLRDPSQTGFLPRSFVVPIVAKDCEPAGSAQHVYAARAMYDFTSSNPDDLPLTRGEALLASPVADSPEWTEATRGTRSGFVPSNYVEMVGPDQIEQVVTELAGASPAASGASGHKKTKSKAQAPVEQAAPVAYQQQQPQAVPVVAAAAVAETDSASASAGNNKALAAAIAKTRVPEGEKLYTITVCQPHKTPESPPAVKSAANGITVQQLLLKQRTGRPGMDGGHAAGRASDGGGWREARQVRRSQEVYCLCITTPCTCASRATSTTTSKPGEK